ncbi:MAG: SOS response-associated peptidase [Rhodospirillaceae bacterium]|nr:SOS response-associated peptidase [Rhodospirillaceae bacterium]
MCGRYSITTAPEALRRLFRFLNPVPNLPPRYNLAPTQDAPVVRLDRQGRRELGLLRWGLVPYWSKGPKHGYSMINARAETVAAKASFRGALERRRCLVPADGFFEWRREGRRRQPHYITLKSGQPFAFAGLWDRWKGPEGERVESFTIIVTDANAAVAPIHDRMPVILEGAAADLWLEAEEGRLQEAMALLKPIAAEALAVRAVSPRVNSVENDGPECIAPIAEPPAEAPAERGAPKRKAKTADGRQLKLLDD